MTIVIDFGILFQALAFVAAGAMFVANFLEISAGRGRFRHAFFLSVYSYCLTIIAIALIKELVR